MKFLKILTFRTLQGGNLFSLALIALPWVVLTILGMIWLIQEGYFLYFVLGTTTALIFAKIPRFIRAWRRSRAGNQNFADESENDQPIVDANPDWTASEIQIYSELCKDIATRVSEPHPWRDLQGIAFEIVEDAARKLSDGQKGALDFSLPEALLLTDRVLLRLRATIRQTLPLSDRISLGSLFWIWEKRAKFQAGMNMAKWGWKLYRLASGPVQAVAQEVQNAVLGGASASLSSHSLLVLQRMILEEIAHGAIELHSGRLRFSEAELLQIELASEIADRQAIAKPDAPLRLLIVGQVSAGKSTLINALAQSEIAETDMAPTTDGIERHDMLLEGLPYHVIDTQGLDGSKQSEDELLEQMMNCDMVLWVVRANRPARAPDVALMERFGTAMTMDHRIRKPPLIVAISAADTLMPKWPYPEHILPDPERQTLTDLVAAVAHDLDARLAIPVCAEEPVWNVDFCAAAISDCATEALMTQRNRRRIKGEVELSTWSAEAGRIGAGVTQAAELIWSRIGKGKT